MPLSTTSAARDQTAGLAQGRTSDACREPGEQPVACVRIAALKEGDVVVVHSSAGTRFEGTVEEVAETLGVVWVRDRIGDRRLLTGGDFAVRRTRMPVALGSDGPES